MPRRRRATVQELRTAIECLPAKTRVAMLEGIRTNEIIVGAYTDGRGGVCPMLAAHRAGGRTDFIGFARAWDRFANPSTLGRRATKRELLILKAHLETSLLDEEVPAAELAAAMAEHRKLVARRGPAAISSPPTASERRRTSRAGDADRTQELRGRPGWAWLRVFRRYDDYERALATVESERRALDSRGREREPELVD